jgi:hypothetical protein
MNGSLSCAPGQSQIAAASPVLERASPIVDQIPGPHRKQRAVAASCRGLGKR